jgi:hypothetical protein
MLRMTLWSYTTLTDSAVRLLVVLTDRCANRTDLLVHAVAIGV